MGGGRPERPRNSDFQPPCLYRTVYRIASCVHQIGNRPLRTVNLADSVDLARRLKDRDSSITNSIQKLLLGSRLYERNNPPLRTYST